MGQPALALARLRRGYYKIPEELPAMQAFVCGEATAAAYRIALQFEPERKGNYTATRETLRFLR